MSSQLERVLEEKSLMQSDLSVKTSEITLLKTNEKRLLRDTAETRERAKSLEEELHKVSYSSSSIMFCWYRYRVWALFFLTGAYGKY